MEIIGTRKRGGKPVKFEWEREGLYAFLRIVAASGRAVAVIDLEPELLRILADNYRLI